MKPENIHPHPLLRQSISPDELNLLPEKSFEGEIMLVEDLDTLKDAVSWLKKQTVLGFDTEAKPSFKRGQTNPVALLQLATAERAVLIRLSKIGLRPSLAAILSNADIVKAGVATKDDIVGLRRLYSFVPGGFVELQSFVKQYGITDNGLRKLCGLVLGVRISKARQLSNWELPLLSESQLRYAATDAWAGYAVYTRLSEYELLGGIDPIDGL